MDIFSTIMEFLIIFKTTNGEKLVRNLFGQEKYKEVILDRAKLRFVRSSVSMEDYSHNVIVMVSMLTPFGAVAVSKFLQKKIDLKLLQKILVGDNKLTVFNDQIREALLAEYMKIRQKRV